MPSDASFFDSQSQAGGVAPWNNIANVEASDDSYTDIDFFTEADDTSNILSVFNMFDFSVPNAYLLLGIEVSIQWVCAAPGLCDIGRLALEQNQTIIAGSTNRTGGTVPAIEVTDVFGSSTDVWGTGFTHVNDLIPAGGTIADFGVGVAVTDEGFDPLIQIDSIQMTIHFQPTHSGAKFIRGYYRSPKRRRLGTHPAGF